MRVKGGAVTLRRHAVNTELEKLVSRSFDNGEFRRVLGHYPTGVCAVTAMSGDAPVGMVVGSFTSVSLEPPLVAFFPDRTSRSWPKIRAAGRFCISVLADHQSAVCRALASKAENKFEQVPYRLSRSGIPIVEGCVAWIECNLYAVYDAGDHFTVLGEVHFLDTEPSRRPLLFYQGSYGGFSPLRRSAEAPPSSSPERSCAP